MAKLTWRDIDFGQPAAHERFFVVALSARDEAPGRANLNSKMYRVGQKELPPDFIKYFGST